MPLHDRRAHMGTHYGVAALATLVTSAIILTLHQKSFRTLVSIHGLLHVAIARHLEGSWIPARPENPLFAGERLPYYWFYHYIAARLGAAMQPPARGLRGAGPRLGGARVVHRRCNRAVSGLGACCVAGHRLPGLRRRERVRRAHPAREACVRKTVAGRQW